MEYLLNKVKSEDDVAAHLGINMTNLGSYDRELDNWTESAMGLMACVISVDDVDVEENDFAEV